MAGTFRYKGRVYPYIVDDYQSTRLNERAVEVPVALGYYNEARRPLEIGAVLPHYIPGWPECLHTVVDLHEQFPAVINADVLTYEPDGPHDVVISVSTLDHLKNADEVLTAVKRMKSWVAYSGLLYMTLPANQPAKIGGGDWLDRLIESGALDMPFVRMDKVDPGNHAWAEVGSDQPARLYGYPTTWANTVYLFEWRHE